jgi:hypothetical protein
MGLRVGLDGSGKSRPHRDLIPVVTSQKHSCNIDCAISAPCKVTKQSILNHLHECLKLEHFFSVLRMYDLCYLCASYYGYLSILQCHANHTVEEVKFVVQLIFYLKFLSPCIIVHFK